MNPFQVRGHSANDVFAELHASERGSDERPRIPRFILPTVPSANLDPANMRELLATLFSSRDILPDAFEEIVNE